MRHRSSWVRAASLCVLTQLPFTLNMVLTAHNRHEVAEIVELAGRLGSAGVRLGWLMPTPETAQRGLDLSPEERCAVESEIRRLQRRFEVEPERADRGESNNDLVEAGRLTAGGGKP